MSQPGGGFLLPVSIHRQPFLHHQSRSPGTEFLDAETERQKSPSKRANACRDPSPEIQWPKIPVETTYLASYRKRAACEDWMVEVIGLELETHHPVIEPVSAMAGNGNF
jgi:hypothetical protein